MSLITATNLHKAYGSDTVLEDISIRVNRGEKIGVVGKNGGGKSTLLKILIGREEADRGTVHVARGVRIGYLSQVASLDDTRTVRDEARAALDVLFDAENELRETEQYLAQNPNDADALDAYASARDRFDFAGGERAEDNLFSALSAMGFSEADIDKPVGVLSGGEKTRLGMAKLLASAPDVLALDEPTNHLDIRAVEWLEGFLLRFPGSVIVISHDRRFLQNVAATIWEVEAHHLNVYSGGFASYQTQRAAIRARQLEEYERQQAEIERTEEFIRRNKAGQNTRIAMGRQKRLDRLERLERPVEEPDQMKAKIASSGRSGREVVVSERLTKRYGEKSLLENATFTLMRGDRVGIVGPNGAGKSTLIEMIVGEESPDSGYIRRGHGTTVAYHKQEADPFDSDLSVLENFYDHSGMSVGEARSHLARFLFTGDDVYKPVGGLSGGERSKLAMALMVLSPANLLILDEPTNHLDVFSCDALTDALNRYDGTLFLVSHDRALLDATTNKTLALDGGGKFTLFDGPYGKWRQAQAVATVPLLTRGKKAIAAPPPPTASAHAQSKERQRALKRVSVLEADIGKLEARQAEVEAGLSAPSSADAALALAREYEQVQAALLERMEEWEVAVLEAEAMG